MILGVTGAPGSGKSLLVRVMADAGWLPVDADHIGKNIVEGNPAILAELSRLFGNDIIGPDGVLERRLLASRAFASAENTRRLNAAVHPALVREITRIMESHRAEGTNAVVDCALIFEWGIADQFDRIVCVRADEEVRRARIRARDRRTPEDIDRLFAAQLSEEEKARRAHISIRNDGSIESIAAYGLMIADIPRYEEGGKGWTRIHPQNG